MKTKIPFPLRLLLFACLATVTQISLCADENVTTATAKLSSPGKPSTLQVDVPWADIHIKGVDGDTVTVESSLNRKGRPGNPSEGLRRLDDEVSFELSEHDNIVSLSIAGGNPGGSNDADFMISVPRAMALDVKAEIGGDLNITNTEGDIEVNNMNGSVQLEGIAGSTVVNTMNGEVRAIYAKVPQKLISITSMNGEIDLRVPVETKANVRLRTHNGSILTDFDESALKTKSEGKSFTGSDAANMGADAARATAEAARNAARVAQEFAREIKHQVEQAVKEKDDGDATPSPDVKPEPRAPRPPLPPMPPITGGKLVSGTLNGGGVDIKISTMNGEITLRQTAPNAAAAASRPASASTESEKVTVIFQDPDKFTDVGDRFSTLASTAYLDELRDYVREIATAQIAADNKLTVTFLDLDLAGMVRPDRDNIRIMTDTTPPRAWIKFELIGANGQILKEGERRLSDLNYLQSMRIQGRSDQLFYDKELLKDWIRGEFRKTSR